MSPPRKHRGPHPEDRQLFAADQQDRLRQATFDLSWLWSRGYATPSAVKLVGDRYCLDARQRLGVARCACADDHLCRRRRHRIQAVDLQHQQLWIDGFNVLTSVEAALAGGAILIGRDGCYRDMASMHGSYRKVDETTPAIELLGQTLAQWNLSECHWLLDQPVSNSGRLKSMLHQISRDNRWPWQVQLVPDPDPLLIRSPHPVASSDSQILNAADRWFDLARSAIEQFVPQAWRVDLAGESA